ncbi:MAG TPA: NADH-quinone oxidoreductase subunit C [Candidatus Acidoferrales bacterium]|nr:NADH-quinone oxidoreductase subunit C [Candidatus Acidoferrales bacterium]
MNEKASEGPRQSHGGPPAVLTIPQTAEGRPARLVTLFGSLDARGSKRVHYIFDDGSPAYAEALLPADGPVRSMTLQTPAAAWHERELHDKFGIEIVGHPDLRPLIFHENWPECVHPMVDTVSEVPWANRKYRFLEVQGEGVAEVAVGPVHAGIIEPGHFRFSVVGDTILHLELRHFYTHKGTEKLFQGRTVADGVMLAESVSGDNCFAHAVCCCQAAELALGMSVPPRAAAIQLIGLELERLVCHISDVGGLCTDVGFAVAAASATRIKETLLEASAQCCGTRYWRGIAVPGGLRRDFESARVAELARAVASASAEFANLARMILETPSIQNRFEGAGILSSETARDLGVVGPVARASGVDYDVRREHPYGGYGQGIEVPTTHYGDVMARARIRIGEAAISARLIQETAGALSPGSIFEPAAPAGDAQGFSAVESPRGELLYWLEVRGGRLARCHIQSPSFQNWPAMPFAVADNIIADFPLINKSFNLSYSGCDR